MKSPLTTLVALLVIVSSFAQQAPLPDKAQKLRDSFRQALDRATTPLTKTYLAELQKLKTEYTKSGNLEAALAIDAEIKSLSSTPDAAAPAASQSAPQPKAPGKRLTTSERKTIRGYFVGKTWEFKRGTYIEWFYFADDGTGRRLTIDGVVKPTLKWTLADDGELTMSNAGYTKKVRFTSPNKAAFANHLPDGSTENGDGAELSTKTIPEK